MVKDTVKGILFLLCITFRRLNMKTIADFPKMKEQQDKIVMVTAYDYPSAKLCEQQGVDMILVGDSLGMVVLGYESTIQVTVADMVHHAKAVRRGAPNTFVVVDMPFGSYHGDPYEALKTAIYIFQETGANALKVEGAGAVLPVIKLMIEAGIPVVGHLGLQPQQSAMLGGYKVQGKTKEQAKVILEDALKLQELGVSGIVFECIPKEIMKAISNQLSVVTIGIGAGKDADGQVLVFHDVLHYGNHHIAKFVGKYADIGFEIANGISRYIEAVKLGDFPNDEQSFHLDREQRLALYGGRL